MQWFRFETRVESESPVHRCSSKAPRQWPGPSRAHEPPRHDWLLAVPPHGPAAGARRNVSASPSRSCCPGSHQTMASQPLLPVPPWCLKPSTPRLVRSAATGRRFGTVVEITPAEPPHTSVKQSCSTNLLPFHHVFTSLGSVALSDMHMARALTRPSSVPHLCAPPLCPSSGVPASAPPSMHLHENCSAPSHP